MIDHQTTEDEHALYDILTDCFKSRIETDKDFCHELWSALANVSWIPPETNRETGFTFRQAAKFIARMRKEEDFWDYTKYYLHSEDGIVSPEIAEAMKKCGWTYRLCRGG